MSYSSGLLYWMRTLYHKLLASLYSLIFEVIKSGKLKSVMRSVAFVVHVQAFSIQSSISNLCFAQLGNRDIQCICFANSSINYLFEQRVSHNYTIVHRRRKYLCCFPLHASRLSFNTFHITGVINAGLPGDSKMIITFDLRCDLKIEFKKSFVVER